MSGLVLKRALASLASHVRADRAGARNFDVLVMPVRGRRVVFPYLAPPADGTHTHTHSHLHATPHKHTGLDWRRSVKGLCNNQHCDSSTGFRVSTQHPSIGCDVFKEARLLRRHVLAAGGAFRKAGFNSAEAAVTWNHLDDSSSC